jgi:hypothetical protein
MSVWYLVCDSSDAEAKMREPNCITTALRFSVDEGSALLKYTNEVDGSIDHGAAVALCNTPEWQGEP